MPSKTLKLYNITTHPAVGPKVVVQIRSTSINEAAYEWAVRGTSVGMSTFIKMEGGKRGYNIQGTDGYHEGRRDLTRMEEG